MINSSHFSLVACLGTETMSHYINFKERWNNACENGYLDKVELMISKEARNYWTDVLCNEGMSNACFGGHMSIVELMISNGAKNWNWGLESACQGGHLEMVEFM